MYFNGDIVRYADAKIGLLTHALNYGTGIFEGIRAYWNERQEQLFVMRMPEHYERMRVNARTMLMKLDVSLDELCAVSLDLLRRNGYREDAYLRPLLFKAAEVIGVKLHDVPDSLAIVTTPMGDYVGTEGIRCMISSWRRPPGAVTLSARPISSRKFYGSKATRKFLQCRCRARQSSRVRPLMHGAAALSWCAAPWRAVAWSKL